MLDFSKNYFELFGMSVGYQLDRSALADRYRDLQRVLHPDRFASASEQERRMSLQGTALVNEAYSTLRDPVKRAIYLLELSGLDMGSDSGTIQDVSFLMEQLEMREQLEQLRASAEPMENLAAFIDELGGKIRAQSARLAVLFDTPGEKDLDEALECVRKMQFLEKLRVQADALEAELESAL